MEGQKRPGEEGTGSEVVCWVLGQGDGYGGPGPYSYQCSLFEKAFVSSSTVGVEYTLVSSSRGVF